MTEQHLDFSVALLAMKEGKKAARAGWNLNRMREGTEEPKMYATAQVPDENSKMGKPYLYIVPVEEAKVPWFPSNADLFAADWYVVS